MKKSSKNVQHCSLEFLVNHPLHVIQKMRAGQEFDFTIGGKTVPMISQTYWTKNLGSIQKRIVQGEQMLVSYDKVPILHLRKPRSEDLAESPTLKLIALLLPSYRFVRRERTKQNTNH